MHAISLPRFRFGVLLVGTVTALLSACDNPLALPPPSFENRVDTVTIFALTGTPIQQPSAYDIINRTPARTDRAQAFDFAFDLDSAGRAVLLPTRALGLTAQAGIAVQTAPFDSVVRAPDEGFVEDSIVRIREGDVFVGRSRVSPEQCALLGSLPRYGKFRVLTVDPSARAVTFELLVNANCGFRNLQPGFPES